MHDQTLGKSQLCTSASLSKKQKWIGDQMSEGKLPNFEEGDFIFVSREDFHAEEKLWLDWRGLSRVKQTVNNYEFW